MQEFQITIPLWVSIKAETRNTLRELLLVPRSGQAIVETDAMGNATVISDGSTNDDLKSITVEKLQDFLGSVPTDINLYDLFKMAVDKVEGNIVSPVENVPTPEPTQPEQPVIPQETPTESPIVPESEMLTVNNPLQCDKCGYSTAKPRALTMHKTKKHPKVSVA